ncbi:tetratricopeptide repeat protein [Saccharothrix xinjiangensis]|uniref:Tetratricopeptide repeat protein n=1 Tax=Saccharothrix xinjiangensis TaxID=204798 RepID=A0ABV9Y015_9PSEU
MAIGRTGGVGKTALDHCRRALALQQEIGDTYWQAHTRGSLGSAHHHLGRHREATPPRVSPSRRVGLPLPYQVTGNS